MHLSGFDPKDIALVAELYRDSTMVVQNTFGTTAELECQCGVKQGDIISPTVFSILMNVLLHSMSATGAGYTHSSGVHCNFLAFADDIVLITDDATKMQTLVREVQIFASWSHMWVNIKKCRMSAIDFATGKELDTTHILYNPHHRTTPQSNGIPFPTLHPDKPYKYLGYSISLSLNWKEHKQLVGVIGLLLFGNENYYKV